MRPALLICGFSIAILVLVSQPLPAQDWESFAASSDKSQDGLLHQVMGRGDLDTNLAICRGIGRRQDADLGSFFGPLLASNAHGTADRTELMLRWIITSARAARPDDTARRAWVEANAASVDALLAGMGRWRSPMLKVELIGLAVIARNAISRKALLEAGDEIVQKLNASGGPLSGEDTALAMAFLAAARAAGSPDFLRPCADIARLSRDGTVVEAARAAAAASVH